MSTRPAIFTALLAAAGVGAPAVAVAQAQTVTLWTDSNYSGAPYIIVLPQTPGGLIPLPPFWNDQVTSIQWNLQPGTVLYFYEDANGGGREFTITHDRPRQGGDTNVGSFYNDKFSSLRWGSVDPTEGWVRFYTNTNRGGYELTRYLSLFQGNEIQLINEGYNDQVDSVEWSLPADKTLMCHDEFPAGGKALPLINSGYYADLDNGAFGLYHDNLSTCLIMDGQFTSAYADRNRPIDQVCQLSSHNAHVSAAMGWLLWWQQNMTLIEQLDYGARCLQIDIDDHNGQLFLVHGTWAATLGARAGVPPEPLGPTFQAIRNWLLARSEEVLFIDVQNDAGLQATTAIANSVLAPFLYVPDGLHWPSINELVALGKRVVVFNSSSSGVGQLDCYEWRVENGYDSLWTTTARTESDAIDGKNRSIFFMNNISGTSTPTTWFGNSPNDYAPLLAHALSFAQPPTLISIDGIEMADHAGLEVCRAVNALRWGMLPQASAYRFHDSCGGATELTVFYRPQIGGTLSVDGAPLHVTVLGFSDVGFGGLALPTPVPGITNCNLRVSPDAIYLSDVNGKTNVPIPSQTGILGVELFLQGAQLTGSSWPLTNGVAARVGL